MPLNTRAFTITLSIVAASAYLFGALLHVVTPWGAPSLLSYIFHVDVTALAKPFSWDSFTVGLVLFAALGAFLGALTAWLYNTLAHQGAAARSPAAVANSATT